MPISNGPGRWLWPRRWSRAADRTSTLELFTPHLMGTCRMGSNPADSVVNLAGERWDPPGCYVADASLFPTAIGVNSQITIMALVTRVAERVKLSRLAA